MSKEDKNIAEIQFINDSARPMIKVIVPRGTSLEKTIKLQPLITDLLGKLRGCLPCNSGVPIWFQEREEIEQIVRVDLERMQRIG